MLGWSAAHVPLFLTIPVLLVASAFFSGSETALFGLSDAQRRTLRREHEAAARLVDRMLAEPRLLLITILLGNMIANVLFFVTSSVLMMEMEAGVIGELAAAVVTLLLVVLFGEVIPKMTANARGGLAALVVSRPLYAIHRVLGPVRGLLDALVIAPLSRLTAPREAPPALAEDELGDLLELSSDSGVISPYERRVLQEVIRLHRMKVRDVMSPRVNLVALPETATREEVVRLAKRTRLTKFPVYLNDLDEIAGILHVKRYLLDPRSKRLPVISLVQPARFVPEHATLDNLLDHFRRTHTQSAIVVDEYGGTAGLVAVEDVVSEIVGELSNRAIPTERLITPLGGKRWRVDGRLSIHDFVERFAPRAEVSPRVSTFAGYVTEALGHLPGPGDAVEDEAYRIEVERVRNSRVQTAILTELQPPAESEEGAAREAEGGER